MGNYNGPCDKIAYLSGTTAQGKKEFEASCEVSWPKLALECLHNYTIECPSGWTPTGRGECHAPPTYAPCSKVQQFGDMSPSEKLDWEHLCGAAFPCAL